MKYAEDNRVSLASAPREIGYLTRIEGLASALSEINLRLGGIQNQIYGMPQPSTTTATPQISGLRATLERAEDNVREIMNRLEQLNGAL